MNKVFVSYAYPDREFAAGLVAALREKLRTKIQFVLDTDVVRPGDNFLVTIADTLSQADALIVIISQASSSSDWVRSEVAWALAQKEGRLPIFPVLIGSTDDIPYMLKSRVYADFTNKESFGTNIESLAIAILRNLETSSSDNLSYKPTENFEYVFFEAQQASLELQRQTESIVKARENARLLTVLAILILCFTLFVPIGIITFRGVTEARELLTIILAPITGLVGTVLGFYFGRRSSADEAS